MATMDIFASDAFSQVTLSDALTRMPTQFGRINSLGLFASNPVPTTSVIVEIENGVLNLIPSAPRGAGKATGGIGGKRELKSFVIPHFPHEDNITTLDVQNVRPFGQEFGLETAEAVVTKKLTLIRKKFDQTLEFLRASALRGSLIDANGSVIYNYYTEFGGSQNNFAFPLDNSSADIGSWIESQVGDWYELNSEGEMISGLHAFCSSVFFEKLVKHPSVKEAYKYFTANQNPLREDLRTGFNFHGITFEKYLGRAAYLNPDNTTTTQKFVPDNEAIIFPLGTTDTFTNHWAPMDHLDFVNTPGLEFYSQLVPARDGRSIAVQAEMNPLPMVKRPKLVSRATITS